jgi:hypothetical protein
MTFNRYAYCLNNPYKYVDPDGRWERDVHYDETLVRSQKYFIYDSAKVIAEACIGVDSILGGISFMPLIGDPSYHFNTGEGVWNSPEDTRIIHGEYHLQKAIGMAMNAINDHEYIMALKELGIGLHGLQDVFAHEENLDLQKFNGIFYYHDSFITLQKNQADNKKNLPERLDNTKKVTDEYLGRFNEALAALGARG